MRTGHTTKLNMVIPIYDDVHAQMFDRVDRRGFKPRLDSNI